MNQLHHLFLLNMALIQITTLMHTQVMLVSIQLIKFQLESWLDLSNHKYSYLVQ